VIEDPDLRDLPGLREWGDELREATSRAEDERVAARRRRRLPVRRLGIALAAMFLLVPGAVATRSIWDNPVQRVAPLGPVPSTPTVRLAQGESFGVAWRLAGYQGSGPQRCLRFDVVRSAVAGGEVAGCSAPKTPARLTVQVSAFPGVGFVYGTTTASVRNVDVVVPGGRRVRVATAAVAPEVLRRSRMRGAFRVYVAAFAEGLSTRHAPDVTGLDATGRTVGSLPG
jgi:hypothetical protein